MIGVLLVIAWMLAIPIRLHFLAKANRLNGRWYQWLFALVLGGWWGLFWYWYYRGEQQGWVVYSRERDE